MYHEPVLLAETLEQLKLKEDSVVIDCNLGGGGHALPILEATSPHGILIGIDLDADAIAHATETLRAFEDRTVIVQDNFSEIESIIENSDFENVDAVLFDLGLSKFQLEGSERGFTFQKDEPLEMSFSHNEPRKAADILNTESVEVLTKVFREYGELKNAHKLAHVIAGQREEKKFETVGDLVDVANRVRIQKIQKNENRYLSQVFQSLRIEVNNELEHLRKALKGAVAVLKPSGRLAVISYHSLEDRIVKHFFKDMSVDCVCPPEFPVCTCSTEAQVSILTKKPIVPTEEEITKNNKSRSAKLRVVEKI